jgi:hypothetical protein
LFWFSFCGAGRKAGSRSGGNGVARVVSDVGDHRNMPVGQVISDQRGERSFESYGACFLTSELMLMGAFRCLVRACSI